MKRALVVSLVLGLVLGVAGVFAEGTAQSGPGVGKEVPGPFHPLNVTGESAGQKACLYCSNGANPVAVVFAREIGPDVTNLLRKLDEATVKNSKSSMGSYAVFCSDKDGLAGKLKALAEQQKIKSLVLSIDNPAGPKAYNIAKEADVTVLLYSDFTVRANHAFKKGELNDKTVERVVADVAKILPKN